MCFALADDDHGVDVDIDVNRTLLYNFNYVFILGSHNCMSL